MYQIVKGISDEMLANELNENQRAFLSKATAIFNNEYIYEEFTKKYEELSKNSRGSILSGLKKNLKQNKRNQLKFLVLAFAEGVLTLLLFIKLLSKFVVPIPIELLDKIDSANFIALLSVWITLLLATKSAKEEAK